MTGFRPAALVSVAFLFLAGSICAPADATDYLLALSWQPSFCATHPGRAECATPVEPGFAPHGLWPQPESNIYCQVSSAERDLDLQGLWERLPAPLLSDAVRADLARAMPGVRSFLDRHEWTKHGACSRLSPDLYFSLLIRLSESFKKSAFAVLIKRSAGRTLMRKQLCDALRHDFGDSIGSSIDLRYNRQGVAVDGRLKLTEIWIYLTDRGNVKDMALDQVHLASGPGTLSCLGLPISID